MSKSNLPKGWDAERVQRLIDHYESMSEDELVAEDEAAAKTKNLDELLASNAAFQALVAKSRASPGKPFGKRNE
jgi:hypothetical protein